MRKSTRRKKHNTNPTAREWVKAGAGWKHTLLLKIAEKRVGVLFFNDALKHSKKKKKKIHFCKT